MIDRRVTMQDIANACGLSRNTVSKVFNNHNAVPEATRVRVLQTAKELGYGTFYEEAEKPLLPTNSTSIVLLTGSKPSSYHFGISLLTKFTDQVSRAGYTFQTYELSNWEIEQKKLPSSFQTEQTAGIIGMELFDRGYQQMVCALGLPTVFVDSYAHACNSLLSCDIVSMENTASTVEIVQGLVNAGAVRIGFVGDKEHCNSFYERWLGFCIGLENAGLVLDKRCCILENDHAPYNNATWLNVQLDKMPDLPDAFVCANDFLAIHLMLAMKQKGLSIPGDIMITGFDGSAESMLVDPQLTTVQIPSAEMGSLAAELLLNRIKNPEPSFTWTRMKTTPIWRASVRTLAVD